MRGVKPLPEAVRSSVRSGVILYDLTRVVEELVFNSLDSGAKRVSVFVGVGTCYVKVVDDGCGITRDGLVLLGERYATSKFDHFAETDAASESFGFRGEALASISDVSLLEIVTKAFGRPNGYRKVMKGCKCLYLGIDDDRKDVGTTVVVRDLFYNQPVRRKCMQSSPNKVLHSVKKCVHRISLVHSKVSFKVVDVESEDELLCTIASPSPLKRLKQAFGVEVSAALHELNISDGKLELSGYISSPCSSLTIKAFQYLYINTQFICKGPIHKLLKQLATSFEFWDPGKAVDESQNRKRSRPQAFPAYVLNLSCPRSFYDLTFEPSKTYVEFKDWVPVLTFIDKAIQDFWKEKISSGETVCDAADIVGEDQMWKEGDSIVSADESLLDGDLLEVSEMRKKKSRIQNREASPDLTKTLITEDNLGRHVKISYLHENTGDFNHFEAEFGHHTDYSFQSRDTHLAKCMLTAPPKRENHPWKFDNNFSSEEDYLMENRSPAAGRSSNVEDNIFSSAWQYEPFNVDPSVSNGSEGSGVSCDHLEFSSDVEVTRDLIQPFLKSCSSQGRLPSERAMFTDGGIKFHSDGFGSKRRRAGSYNSSVDIPEIDGSSQSFDFLSRTLWPEEKLSAEPFPRVITKFDLSTEFDSSSRDFIKSIPSEEHFDGESSVMNVENVDSCHQTLNTEWCLTSNSLSQKTYWDFEPFSNKNAVEGCYRSVNTTTNKYFVDSEDKDCRFSSDAISKSSIREQRTMHTDHGLDCYDYAGSRRFLQQLNSDSDFSPECADILADETGWLSWYSHRKDNIGINTYKRQTDQFRYQDCLKNHVLKRRLMRSHSAPPFHRSKRRYSTLNHLLTTTAGKPDAETFHDAVTYPEPSKTKDLHEPPGGCHLNLKLSPVEDLLLDSRYEESQDIKADANKMQKIEMFEQSKCSEIQATAPIRAFIGEKSGGLNPCHLLEFISMDQDTLNCGSKWRNCCPQNINASKMQGIHDQNNILDISSGLLHLAADSLVPESINKNCLKDCRVLQQVDKKFIPVMAGRTLAVIDQHAADERIRLEELRQKVLTGEAKTTTFLDVEQELMLPEIGYQLLHNYAKPIEEWGWLCNINAPGSGSFKRNLNLLHRKPTVITLIAVPCILGVNLSDVDLMEFLQQLADTDGSSTMPPSVLRILNSKACRGAIMFGDSLLHSECSLIVEELKQTSLCFQCAHGRPTTAPLVNLEALHKQIAKIALLYDGADEVWHGLRRHELSLARAKQRLRSAKS